jgi:hypothetical protein
MAEHRDLIGVVGLGGLVVVAAIACVSLIGFSPSFDAYGWLVWGHQLLYGSLNTGAAPSWKPLTFLFTAPFAIAGSHQPWLWMVTATAGAFAAPVFAARVALQLCGPQPGHWYAPVAAATFAACGVIGLGGYWHLIMIASSDPMIVALCLAAIDFHLRGHPRLAFASIVLASLGRPEAWAFALLYGIWAWRSVPEMRAIVVAGLLVIPAAWFAIPAVTSRSPFIAGTLALGFKQAIHGSKLDGTVTRFLNNEPWPMHVAWLAAVILAVVRRDRTALTLVGAAVLWVAIEYAFALHGWPASPRYLLEPAAVLTVLAGAAAGRALAIPASAPASARIAGPVLVAMLLGALLPFVVDRLREAHRLVSAAHQFTAAIDTLHEIVVDDGGQRGILACGHPVTFVGYESTLAWEIGLNVGAVGHRPGRAMHSGRPIVLFRHWPDGWEVLPIHTTARDRGYCRRLLLTPSTV